MTEVYYNIETSLLISRLNQWTGFYMIGTSVVKELRDDRQIFPLILREFKRVA